MLWVTNTTVVPETRRMSSSRSCISIRVSSSSAPNGSSISSSDGDGTSARQSATRCFMPPESWCGRLVAKAESPTRSSNSSARFFAAASLRPAISIGNSTLASTVRHGSRFGVWNTKPKSSCGPTTSRPRMVTRPSLACVMPATMRSSVVLPQPLGPSSEISSPCWKVQETSSSATTRRRAARGGAAKLLPTFVDDAERPPPSRHGLIGGCGSALVS